MTTIESINQRGRFATIEAALAELAYASQAAKTDLVKGDLKGLQKLLKDLPEIKGLLDNTLADYLRVHGK